MQASRTQFDRERPDTPGARLRVSRAVPARTSRDEAMELFLCGFCGEVIGVYEPLVIHKPDEAHITSRAAEPDLRANAGRHYHLDCYSSVDARAT
jgi:hypothetical protein